MIGALGQPARSFWQLPPGTPEWMRPPDWMALGSPGKSVGMAWSPKRKRWEMVEAMAGAVGNPGKIVGYNPDTGEVYYAAAGIGAIPVAAQEAAPAAAAAKAQATSTSTTLQQQQATLAPQLVPTTEPTAKAPSSATLPILAFGAAIVVGGVLLFRRRRATE